jgi:predicted MFS family arabinose efflux permease
MVPVIGESRLHLSAFPIGLLMSADGLGALVGAILVAHWARPRHFRGLYFYGVAGFALSYIVFALSPWPALGGAAQIAVGLASAGFSTMQTTIVFLTTPAGARSRAIGLLSVCVGTSVLGFLHLGLVTDWLGPQGAIVASSLEGLLALALTARVWPEIRPRAPFVQR